jgi:hypothetical protein
MFSFKLGDVIISDKVLYRHYGIYIGNSRVIHYAAETGDFGLSAMVRETSLEQFAGRWNLKLASLERNYAGKEQFSLEETVRRARSRLGEKSYNLLSNNCEHFALWCRYGTSQSVQVEKAVIAAIVLGTFAISLHIAKANKEVNL